MTDIIEQQTDSLFLNSAIGIGDENYDSSRFDDYAFQANLFDSILLNLYRQSHIAKNIVNIFPSESSWGHPIFEGTNYKKYGAESGKLENFINDALEVDNCDDLETLFRTVSKSARLLGVSYLVLGFNDGNTTDLPLDESKIRSLDWIIHKTKLELFPDNMLFPSFYTVTNQYNFYGEQRTLETKIHASRVLKFTGVTKVREDLNFIHDSVLQTVFDALMRDEKGIAVANQMVVKKAVLWAKLNLNVGATNLERDRLIKERLRLINLASSVYRMVGLNRDEELGSNQIDLTGIDKILSANSDRLVASSGLNKFKLLGIVASEGLSHSTTGLEQRLDFSQRCGAYCNDFWRKPLLRVYRLACKTANSPTNGKLPRGLQVDFPNNLIVRADEWAQLRNDNSLWAEKLINLGVISKSEVRQSFFAATDLESQLVPNLILDQTFSDRLMQEAINPPPSVSPVQPVQTIPTVDKQENAKTKLEKAIESLASVDETDLTIAMEDLVK